MLGSRPTSPRRSRPHAVALVAAAGLISATLLPGSPAPFTAPATRAGGAKPACTAEQVKPNLGDFMVNQGLNYPILNRGKQTLVRFFLRMPTTCSTSSAITMAGASLTVTLTYGLSTITSSPLGPIQVVAGTLTSGLQSNAASDPLFLVPASVLTPPASWTSSFKASFTATVAYKVGTDTTPRSLALTTGPTGLPLEAQFEPKTSALRILVVPMGDASSTATQFSGAAQAAVQNALLDLSRMGPFPDGTGDLASMATGGVRFSIDPGLMDIGPKSPSPAIPTSGKSFCGSASNFAAISSALAARLQNYNLLNPNAQADRVLGVVDAAISTGATGGCDEGRAAVPSGGKSAVAAWVRAVPDGTSPSQTGSVLAQEFLHTFGGCASASSSDSRCRPGTYHSTTTTDFSNLRGYNLASRAWLSKPPTIMRFNSVASVWNRTTTLYETSDYLLFSCILTPNFILPAGYSSIPGCTSTTTGSAGTSSGVPAGPTFFLSGSTDGVGTETACPVTPGGTTARYQAPGTTVFDSFYGSTSADLNGQVDPGSQYRLRYYDASGAQLADFGVPTGSSNAQLDMGSTTASPGRTTFSAAFEWDVSTTDVEQVRLVRTGAGGSAAVLWCRNRTDPPEITSVLSTGADVSPCPDIGTGGLIAFIDTDVPGGAGPTSIWATRCGTDRRLIWHNPGPQDLDYPVWSPDGSRLAYYDWNHESWRVIDADGSGEHGVGASPGLPHYLRLTWSPDGTKVAYLASVDESGSTVRIVDGASGAVVTDVTFPGDPAYSLDWSPDGTEFAYALVWVANVDGSGIPTQVANLDELGLTVAGFDKWSPDGRQIALAGNDAENSYIVLASVDDGSITTIASSAAPAGYPEGFQRPTWSADGANILAGRLVGSTNQIVSLQLDNPEQAPHIVIDGVASPYASWGPVTAGALGTISTPTPDDVTMTLTYSCPGTGQVFPVAIGIPSSKVGETEAQFNATFDPTQACAGGTLEVIAKDGFSASEPAPIGALALTPSPPVVAIDNPIGGRAYGPTETVALQGRAIDPETGSLCESTPSPCAWRLKSGTTTVDLPVPGPAVDLLPGDPILAAFMNGSEWKPGAYTATLSVTGSSGEATAASAAFTVAFPPLVTVSGVTDGAVYRLGAVPRAGCRTTDGGSGFAARATVAQTGGNGNGVGLYTATCAGATSATRPPVTAAPVSVTFAVQYTGVSGVLQPINPDNTSIFNRNRVVPVRFRIDGSPRATGFATATWTLVPQQVSCQAFNQARAVVEQVLPSTPSNTFRWYTCGQEYIHNAKIDTLPGGTCWVFKITLDDGSTLWPPTVVTSPIFKTR